MKFSFNIKKRHLFPLLGMIVLVGFVIAQTPPDPGHIATQVNIGGSVGTNLENWANNVVTTLAQHVQTMSGLQAQITALGNCPGGGTMVPVGDFCIELSARSANTWAFAVNDCSDEGLRLCSGVEWVSACVIWGPSGWIVGSNGNWAGDNTGNDAALEYGVLNSCTRTGSQSSSTPELYRCCKTR